MFWAVFLARRLACLTVLIAVSALGLPGAPARADIGSVGEKLPVCVAPVRAGQTIDDLFAGRIALDCDTPQIKLGGGDFWALSKPFRRTGEVALRSGSVWQDKRIVYARYADGMVLQKSSDARMASRNLQLGAIFLDHLPARAAPLAQVAWRIDGAANLRGILVDPRLATIAESGWSNLNIAALYAAFAGLGVALVIHNLALWAAMRHRFQLAYCMLVSMLLAYSFTSSGAIAWVIPDFSNNDRLRLNYIGLGLAAAAAVYFVRSFFEERVFSGWLGQLGVAIVGAVVTSCFAYAVFAPWEIWYFDRVFAISFIALVAYGPLLLWQAWRKGNPYMWTFALAWAVPLLFAGLRIANNLNFISWNFWIDHSTMLSMTLEALLSSVGISYRIRVLGRERDEARVQEIAARALADTDPLTGLLNRRAFLSQAIGRAGAQQLLIIDIDHFKAINETLGHDGGDEVLRVFARALRASARADALVARIGGEEFAVVAAFDQRIDPDDLLARLRAERMPFDLSVTASVGECAGRLTTEIDWKALYRSADRALYEAKRDGRDRARVASPLAA